jgi:hypothetical protein
MNLKIVIALISILFVLATFWPDAGTQAATITVEVGSDASCTRAGTGTSVNIEMNCPAQNTVVKIERKNTSYAARVEILGTPTSQDIIRITNAKITAMQALTNYHIVFYRDDPAGPNTANGNVFYKLWLVGTIFGAGNSLTASATVEHPMPSAPVAVGTKTVTNASFNTSAQAVQWTQVPMAGTRKLKVDLSITLAQGAVLDLGSWVKLANQASADEGGEGHNWLISTTGETTNKWFVESASLTEDGLVKKEAQVHLFMDSNWDHLSQEFAQGHGEYLVSLASLLDVAPTDYPSFCSLAQHHYAELSRSGQVDPQEMLQLLEQSRISPMSVASVSQPR